MLSESLELETPRLRLRRLRPEDAAAVAAYRGLPEVARFQSWESFDLSDAVRLIEAQAAVVPDTPGTWLGTAKRDSVHSSPLRTNARCPVYTSRGEDWLVFKGLEGES